jgi:hypothetical protein
LDASQEKERTMKTARLLVVAFVGFLAVSEIPALFAQGVPGPGNTGGLPQGPQPLPPTGGLPQGPQPLPPGSQPLPPAPVPHLHVVRASQLIGSTAVLLGGVPIGTVQDVVFGGKFGEYALVSYPNGFVMIPRVLTIFDPVSRALQVNLTAAQLSELPALLQIAQLNPQFLERVHTFFVSPRGLAILKNGAGRGAHAPGGAQSRGETRTASKPATHPQTRTEPHPDNATSARR